MAKTVRIGARGSDLAQWQAHWVGDRLEAAGFTVEQVIISTHGDRVQDRPLRELGTQGVFTVELETALLADEIDVAVHSFKDMALRQPDELAVVAISPRANPADLLVIRKEKMDPSAPVVPLPEGSVVGTSAVRRASQLTARRPDLVTNDLRGNVPTRLQKLRDGKHDAIFLAAAGAERLELDLSEFHVVTLEPRDFIPSPAQGALAVEMRVNDRNVDDVRDAIHDIATAAAVLTERELLDAFGGGCSLPLGGYAEREGGVWTLRGFWGGGDTAAWETVSAPVPEGLSTLLAEALRSAAVEKSES